MGLLLPNLIEKVDHATGTVERSFELHMDLPVNERQHKLIADLLTEDDWTGARDALAEVYPQHSALLSLWFSAAAERKRQEIPKKGLLRAVA